MVSLGTITLTGVSGKGYVFHIYAKEATFEAFGAVYAITRTEAPLNPIYIGQTGDTSERFDNHHRLDCFNRHNWNRICIHSEANPLSRVTKERDLIEKYDPPCNKQ